MKSSPFDAAADGLRAVLGESAAEPAVLDALCEVDDALGSFAHDLRAGSSTPARSQGLTVDDYPGPPRKCLLAAYVENGEVTFTVELMRGDFFDNLGRASERFYVEAEVAVASDAPIDYGQETVFSLPVREAETAAEATAALAEALDALRQEAASRPPTAQAWRARTKEG